jgi:hypothetical protein
VQTNLLERGIHAILSGGAATGFYSKNLYVSKDIDLVNEFGTNRKRIETAMNEIGFFEQGRYFSHTDSEFVVEFPPGPLMVGLEPVKKVDEIELSSGLLRIISATDCVKDRLSAFYHWKDEQCLYQACLVSRHVKVDLDEIERWSRNEGKLEEFLKFVSGL